MALRVLLGDESSTIKKVFQLALQDFAVEVKPVNLGVDVLPVAQTFQPDIVFVDVLLQKKSGYDVAAELKQDPVLGAIPVVLMWSGFVELDEDKFQASRADAQLEKPFDVAALRKLVTGLVPRTQGQRLSEFLTFPKAVEEPAQPIEPQQPEDDEPFKQVPIPEMKGAEKFRVNLSPEELQPDHIPVDFADLEQSQSERSDDTSEDNDDLVEDFQMVEPGRTNRSEIPNIPKMNEDQIEAIIRAQSAEIIESVVWKIVPEIATQIIERELSRLLRERDLEP